MRPFSLIASCAENRVIGRDGRLPWRIPEDFAFFQRQTAGQVVVLGRICFETWPGACRDGRRPVVVSRRGLRPAAFPAPEGGIAPPLQAPSFPAALSQAATLPAEIYVCGGQEIFEEAIRHPAAERLYLTVVHASVEGDRFFPPWTSAFPAELARRESADAEWRYTFLTLGR